MDYRICDIPDGGNEPEETKEVSIDFLNAVDWLITLHLQEQEGISSGVPTPEEWFSAVENLIEKRKIVK